MRTSRTANIRSLVNALRVRELQAVLADLNLARSGRKQELIDRIIAALEAWETKASENATNHATSAYYNDLLSSGLRSLQTHAAAARVSSSSSSSASTAAMPSASSSTASASASASTSTSAAYAPRTPPPVVYGRPIPFNAGHHQRPPPTHHHLVPPPTLAAHAHATEVLHASTPASLDGARCFCSGSSTSTITGKVVACVECHLRVHAKCHQLVNAPVTEKNDWYCEICRAALCDPFLCVKKTVLSPVFVKFNRNHATQRIEYTITDQDINDIYGNHKSPGSMKPGSLELQLRCFILKEELGTGTSWPTTSVIAANGFGLQLVQRAPPGQSNPSKVLREQPADLFPYSRVGRNVIEVRTGEHAVVFCFVVQIVEFRDVMEIVNQVRTASQSITYEDAKKNVIKSFSGGGEDEEDDDDAVVATSTVLSLRCPLGLCLIDLPARGVHCKHLQCFDLKTFLLFNKKARSRHYRCTVCHNFIRASELRIDPYLKTLLREVQGDDDLEEVEILPDATWKRRAGDEAEAPPPPKRVKLEASDSVLPPAASVVSVSGGSNDAGSANAPFEIDLSLSSDEDNDDDPGLSAIPTLTATTGTPSSVSATTSTANLSDDDVAIFTVDSDVWDLPPTSGGPHGAAAGSGSGSGGSDVPFPLDNFFASFNTNANANGGSHVDLSSNGSWTSSSSGVATSYTTLPTLATGSGYTASVSAPTWAAGSTTTTAPASAARGSETRLANAMAQLSRNHPHVTNPFDERRPVPASKPLIAPAAATVSGSSGGGGSALDVICLLDSDSE